MGDIDAERSRLRWRCRRGMRELDQLLEGWLERHWEQADDAHRDAFRRLIETEDDRLWRWMVGRERPDDPELARVVEQLGR